VIDKHATESGSSPLPQAGTGFQVVVVFVAYTVLSLVFFGMPLVNRLSQTYIGGGTDPICHIWAIAWWPFALAHRINPLITHALWAPSGYNLVWGTDIPGPSLLTYPITRFFGPVVSYNVLCLIAPPAAAVSAFVLCRYTCGRFWPAMLGGYIFGFSPYMLSHLLAHLVLILVFPVPLLVYITMLRIDREIGRAGVVTGLIVVLLILFLSSTEIFATATVLGATELLLALLLAEPESRSNLIGVTKEIALAYGILTILLAPYLYYVFAPGLPNPPNPSSVFSNDLYSFVLPPPMLLIAPHYKESILGHFFKTAPWWEQAGYLGPGLWIVTLLFARSYWRIQPGKFLVLSFVLIAIMSLGPVLHIAGRTLSAMPWRLGNALPLMRDALPGRFGMYLFLVAAVAAAIYLAGTQTSVWWRVVLAALSLTFIAPDLAIWEQIGKAHGLVGTPGETNVYVPSFFDSGQYTRYLRPGDNVLILPFGSEGSNAGMLWQAQSNFYFNTTDWFGMVAPPDASRWPIMASLHSGRNILDFPEQLDGFLGAHQIKAIIVDSRVSERWPEMLANVGLTAVAADGILFYKVPAALWASYGGATAHQMAQREAAVCFTALLTAANKYVERGLPLAKLFPAEARRLKLLSLPEGQTPPPGDPRWWQNFGLGSWGSQVGVGLVGNYQDLDFLIDDYGPEAAAIFFPFPKKMVKRPKRGYGRLLITFTPSGLQRAARIASGQGKGSDGETWKTLG
jgi:hypothetical protein